MKNFKFFTIIAIIVIACISLIVIIANNLDSMSKSGAILAFIFIGLVMMVCGITIILKLDFDDIVEEDIKWSKKYPDNLYLYEYSDEIPSECLDTCNIYKDRRIGSLTCTQCENCIDFSTGEHWIQCAEIDEAVKHL